MRVGITTFGGDGGKSGIGRYMVELIAALGRLGGPEEYEVLCVESERERMLGSSGLAYHVVAETARSPIADIAWHAMALPGVARRRGYDVLLALAGNRRLPFHAPCPTVGTVHDFSSLHVDQKYDRARMCYIRQVLPRLIRRLTRVLTVSESSKRDIVEFGGVPEDLVEVTQLAADRALYRPGCRDAARRAVSEALGVDAPYVLYTSRIEHPGKNHMRLLLAFCELLERNPDLPHHLVLAGKDWNGAEAVHAFHADCGYGHRIHFTGFVPDGLLPDLYRAADLMVFPSLYEGFGLPILEAMSCGVPVTCANCSSLPEVAGAAAPMFDPRDASQIAALMESLLRDEPRRRRLASAGLRHSESFSWDRTAIQTREALRRAAS